MANLRSLCERDEPALDWIVVPSDSSALNANHAAQNMLGAIPDSTLTAVRNAIRLPAHSTAISLTNSYMIESLLPKQTHLPPSKIRYFATYAGITLSAVMVISALALMILHHGSLPTNSLLNDEASLLPNIGVLMGTIAILSGIGTWMHYKHRKDQSSMTAEKTRGTVTDLDLRHTSDL